MYSKKIISGVSLAAFSFGAFGQASTVAPSTMRDCGQYMEARRINDPQSQIDAYWAVVWVWGYLSRYNVATPQQPVNIPNGAGTMNLLLEKYCREHPLADLAQISTQLVIDLTGTPASKAATKK